MDICLEKELRRHRLGLGWLIWAGWAELVLRWQQTLHIRVRTKITD